MLNKTVVEFSVENVVISERCADMDAYDKVISYPIMVIMFLEVVGHTVKLFTVKLFMCVTMFISVLG